VKSYFVDNDGVKIHVLENGVAGGRTPSLLVCGGIWEPAERAIPILSGLDSHVVAFSFRGRGLSSTPASGYDLAEHLSDIAAVVRHCGLKDYCVLGFSRGASYALGWSLEHAGDLRGLILVDQPPVHFRPGPGSVEYWSNMVYRGVPVLNFMRRETIEGLAREAQQIDFAPRMAQLSIPVAFFVGRNKNARIPSEITAEILDVYARALPAFAVVEFGESGHMIPDDEPQKYLAQIAAFLERTAARRGDYTKS